MPDAPKALMGEFFQLGYVTRDLERALALYRDRYGVADFLVFDTRDFAPPDSPGPFMQVALAYKGPVMIELIQPDPAAPGIYADALRDDGGVNLHHLGYLVDDARLATLADDFRARGIAVPVETVSPAGMALIYADTRGDNGLFSEFVTLREGGRKFFGSIPRN
jgi:hypothetical protein